MADLASALTALKDRSGLSYTRLAERCWTSASTVHRYCRGKVVPAEFGTVERIALACGADRAEVDRLYPLWSRAVAGEAAPEPRSAPPIHEEEIRASAADGDPERRASRGGRRGRAARRCRRWAAVLGALFLVAAFSPSSTPLHLPVASRRPQPQTVEGPAWEQYPAPLPSSFFGVTVNSNTGLMPGFQVGGVRLWDSGTRWSLVEPARARYDWTVLDRLVDAAGRAHLPVVYTFGGTPGWAAPGAPPGPYGDGSRTAPPDDLADWDRFVRAVATRYAGRVEAYELWAFAPSPHFYTGDAATLARMTRRAVEIVRRADPRATLVCPSMGDLWTAVSQRFLLDFAAAGGYRDCDAAGVKLYPRHDGDTPESLVALADLIERTFHLAGVHPALWNTGSAYRVATDRPLDSAQSVAYAVRFYLIGMYVRYARTYFYNWGGTKVPLVLQAAGGPPTEAARAVATLQRWLAGARIASCGRGRSAGLPGTVWQCRYALATPVGQPHVPAVIRWTESGTVSLPAGPEVRTVRYLDGRTDAAPRRLTVTAMPQLDVGAPGDPVLSSGSGSAR
ncbi:helix-turn-helix domain-containing protein [Streptomyces sp. NPDC001205]